MITKTMRLLLLVAAISFAVEALAQHPSIVYLDNGLRRTKQELAMYNVALAPTPDKTYKGRAMQEGYIKMDGEYLLTENGYIEHGKFRFYYPDGSLESEGRYDRGVRVGIWKRFTPQGDPRTDRYYNPEGAALLRKALGIPEG